MSHSYGQLQDIFNNYYKMELEEAHYTKCYTICLLNNTQPKVVCLIINAVPGTSWRLAL